ncbi:MAG TPA: hypothetical protein DCS28_02155 [Candidatus Moranbacteria bacterium]|nr:hypothetical protein [Candidatus Moranbacteria bacterium]HAT74817.1 hypothetical protein [Candidatus Moranbacteria bacterium]
MDLERKIEEIRRKPEHIKLRYVYGMMAISMFFIILLWIFSFTANIKKNPFAELKNQEIIHDFQQQKKSLQDSANEAKNTLNNLNKNLENLPTE